MGKGMRTGAKILRWVARGWSLASIALVLAFAIGEGFNLTAVTAHEWIGLALFPVGVCLGFIVGWWREGAGGALSLACMIVFYAAFLWGMPLALAWPFPLIAAPGALFLASWIASRRRAAA